jgi:hypothetical protein
MAESVLVSSASAVSPPSTPALKRASFPYTSCYCEENIYCFLRKMRLMQIMEQKKLAVDPSFAYSSAYVASHFDVMFAVFISTLQAPENTETACSWHESRIAICTYDLSMGVGGPSVLDDPFVLWDYHAVAFVRRKQDRSWYAVDFDTKIPPLSKGQWIDTDLLVPLESYFGASFFPIESRDKKFTRQNVKVLALKSAANCFRLIACDDYLRLLVSDRSHMLVGASYSQPPPTYPPIGISQDPLLAAILSSSAADPEEVRPENTSKITSTSRNARIATNNLVSFINTRNRTVPGAVIGRDEVLATLASIS